MNLSIIIVSYNVEEYIISCIQSIYKHSKSNNTFEIIVVDNNSSDNSVDKIKNEYPQINLIKNRKNYGYSVAANQGAIESKGEYILFLNPDTLLIENSIDILIKKAKSIKELFILGPALISKEGFKHQSYWRKTSLLNTILSLCHLDFLNVIKNYKFDNFSGFDRVDSISGGAFFLPRNAFNGLRGFDEDLFWMEDIDFCKRFTDKGHKVFFFQLTKIIHYVGRSSITNYKASVSNQLLSKIKYFNKHHFRLSKYVIISNIFFISMLKLVPFFIMSPISNVFRKKLEAHIYVLNQIIFKKF